MLRGRDMCVALGESQIVKDVVVLADVPVPA